MKKLSRETKDQIRRIMNMAMEIPNINCTVDTAIGILSVTEVTEELGCLCCQASLYDRYGITLDDIELMLATKYNAVRYCA